MCVTANSDFRDLIQDVFISLYSQFLQCLGVFLLSNVTSNVSHFCDIREVIGGPKTLFFFGALKFISRNPKIQQHQRRQPVFGTQSDQKHCKNMCIMHFWSLFGPKNRSKNRIFPKSLFAVTDITIQGKNQYKPQSVLSFMHCL